MANTLKSGLKSIMGQQDGGNHVERGEVVVGVKGGGTGIGLEASGGTWPETLRPRVEY